MNANRRFTLMFGGILIGFFLIAAVMVLWYLGQRAGPQVPAPVGEIPAAATPLPTDTPLVFFTRTPTEPPPPTPTLMPSSTPLPTNTQLPSLTPVPTWTATPIIPTLKPVSSGGSGGSGSSGGSSGSGTAGGCYAAELVEDVTIPSGTTIAIGQDFTKTWRILNTGTCIWNDNFEVFFSSGTDMTRKVSEFAFPKVVEPGESVKISAKLTVPDEIGLLTSKWLLRGQWGHVFGVGSGANTPLEVTINAAKMDLNARFNFISEACEATWRNSAGKELECPGQAEDDDGFVQVLNLPHLENRHENEPALWTRPDRNDSGFITGTFPSYEVQNGDHFRAWLGCLEDSKGCNVIFELGYRTSSTQEKSLGIWPETYDDQVTRVDVDLSSLAGETVQFILRVRVNNDRPDRANAFWFVPRISE